MIDDFTEFHRQYLITSNREFDLPDWPRTDAGPYRIIHHPNLETCFLGQDDRTLSLMGFIIDPDHPARTNRDILQRLLTRKPDPATLIRLTENLGGRWLLLFTSPKGSIAFTDACGLRQLYYTKTADGAIHLAAQPELMKRVIPLEPDPDLDLKAFLDSRAYSREHQFFGNRTRYRSVLHLMPNHYLDLESLRSVRFFPLQPLGQRIGSRTLEPVAAILRGSIQALVHRYPLLLPVTSGWDSRVILAAAWEHLETIQTYVMQSPSLRASHPDLTIPPPGCWDPSQGAFESCAIPGKSRRKSSPNGLSA